MVVAAGSPAAMAAGSPVAMAAEVVVAGSTSTMEEGVALVGLGQA
jgi:hypothetical protein